MVKDIEGYEGIYSISDLGTITSFKRKSGSGFIKPYLAKVGYYQVTLYKNQKPTKFLVHRLLAKHFLPVIEGKNFVNHKDGIKTNNNLSNLEWCTHAENMQHARKTGLFLIDKKGKSIKSSKKLINIKTGEIYPTTQLAAESAGVNINTLFSYLYGLSKNKTDIRYLV